MDFILNIISVVTGIVCAASIICSLTPTPKDDEFMGKYVYPFLEALALNVGKAKQPAPREEIIDR